MTYKDAHQKRPFSSLQSIGFSVFPLPRGSKVPIIKWQHYQNVRATAVIAESWDKGLHNVAVVTGLISNITVLDVDSADAQIVIDALNLPPTPCVKTAKGRHYYFRYQAGLSNRVRVGDQAIDIRGDGGYVVAPGSLHPSGVEYEWEVNPTQVDFAPFPDKLVSLLASTGTSRTLTVPARMPIREARPQENRFSVWLDEHLQHVLARLVDTAEGSRNDSLFRLAVGLAADVAAARDSWEPYATKITCVGEEIGLTAGEVQRTLESAWKNGKQTPTEWITTASDWIYVAERDQLMHLESQSFLRPRSFDSSYNSCWPYDKGTLFGFLANGDYINKVQSLIFDPTLPSAISEKDGLIRYNIYRPSAVTAVEGDSTPFQKFISHLIPNEVEREHLLKMIAWTVRNPGRKLMHALLLRSAKQGVGKSTLIEIWRHMIGVHNTRKTSTDEIQGQYQGFINQSLMVFVEELSLGFGAVQYNRLKDLITGETAVVNEKYIAVKEQPNLATFLLLTNLATPILIEDSDRRIFYIDTPAEPQSSTYYSDFHHRWRDNLELFGAISNQLISATLTQAPHRQKLRPRRP